MNTNFRLRHISLSVSIICSWVFALGISLAYAETEIPGLSAPVQVIVASDGVAHFSASNDLDLARAQGYVHARDRFFQMDLTRRQVDGTLSEVLGLSQIGSDIQARVVGLKRAAERSELTLPTRTIAQLQAYADGVNAYLDTHPLPPEYALLELTQARPWTVTDSLTVAKGIAASFSLDIDVGPTEQFFEFVSAGIAGGFDGAALYFEDVVRSAPIDPASTVPDAGASTTTLAALKLDKLDRKFLARAADGARQAKAKLARNPVFAQTMQRREFQVGSNGWAISADLSKGNKPLIANDPHLALNIPSTWYELHLVVADDPDMGPMNVNGGSFPGIPGVVVGQNEHIAWGATVNGLDVSDTYLDELHVLLPECFLIGAFACIFSEGTFHAVDVEFPTYFTNIIGDNIVDNLVDVTGTLPPEAQTVASVPFRSFGPIINITDPSVLLTGGITTALTLQFTGFHATREIDAFLEWNRAHGLEDFVDGLSHFDVGAQNWSFADADGNIAYFSSAEAPLRRDLEAGTVDGLGPAFIRNGLGDANWVPDPAHSQGQAIPYAILPFDEMPHTINPANGFFVTANNDPAGTTLDNNPLNQVRPSNSSALYYLAPVYANGLRAGRITRLIQDRIDAGGGKFSEVDMKKFQANVQQLDAELMTPFLLEAFENAGRGSAPTQLATFASDAEMDEAIGRLADWDFSTPTGIPEGYDAMDANGHRQSPVKKKEASASVAATIYNLWRGKSIRAIIDGTLADHGLGVGSTDALKGLHNLLVQDPFTGVGASGLDFFPTPTGLTAEERRDVALLAALRESLDALASNDFSAAFGNSTDQDDYRWGKLHRITFDHPFVSVFSIPPAAGFEDLATNLTGVARDGGYEVVNASGFSARAAGLNSFKFGAGASRRYVGIAGKQGSGGGMIRGFNASPGGPSGIPGSPLYATQLDRWLTSDYFDVVMGVSTASRGALSSETLVPAP